MNQNLKTALGFGLGLGVIFVSVYVASKAWKKGGA